METRDADAFWSMAYVYVFFFGFLLLYFTYWIFRLYSNHNEDDSLTNSRQVGNICTAAHPEDYHHHPPYINSHITSTSMRQQLSTHF